MGSACRILPGHHHGGWADSEAKGHGLGDNAWLSLEAQVLSAQEPPSLGASEGVAEPHSEGARRAVGAAQLSGGSWAGAGTVLRPHALGSACPPTLQPWRLTSAHQAAAWTSNSNSASLFMLHSHDRILKRYTIERRVQQALRLPSPSSNSCQRSTVLV